MHGRLTRIDKDITKVEGKRTLGPTDKRNIKLHFEQVKDDNKEFEKCHLEVLNCMNEEDQDVTDAEEKVHDAHGSLRWRSLTDWNSLR